MCKSGICFAVFGRRSKMAGLKKFKPEEDFIRRLKYLAHHATNLAVTAGYFMKT